MTRQRQHWEPRGKDQELLREVISLINDGEYRPFWPLTLRQIYYGLVGSLVIENTKGVYKQLGSLIAKARLSGKVPWRAVMDNNRDMLDSGGFADADDFISYSTRDFLRGYSRDLHAAQHIALEVWVEKDALARVVHDVSQEYSLPTVVAKGYSSVSYVNELRNRVNENWNVDRATKILYFGDLDPSGWNMLPAMFVTLYEEMGLDEDMVRYERCALNREQVKKFKLPQNPDALKDDEWQRTRGDPTKTKGDPRAESYKKMFGKLAVELDAFKPRALQDVVRQAILRHIDLDVHEKEKREEQKDLKRIERMQKKMAALIKE